LPPIVCLRRIVTVAFLRRVQIFLLTYLQLANWTKHTRRLLFWPSAPLCEDTGIIHKTRSA